MDRANPLPPLLPAREAGVLTITLNRPEARNALSESLMRALQLTLDEAVDDKATKVIVIAAKGPAFSAGHDLKEMSARRDDSDHGLAYFRAVFAQCSHLMQTIARHPKPVIAQVHAVATAAGCQLVASCDLAVASSEARFATPGVNIGLFCSTPMVALSRAVPRKAAMEMLLTGEAISAEEARRLGLINRVVAPAELVKETQLLARFIASKPTNTLRTGK
jgi:enoyl-CoA hydratase/carnithine racemase